MRILITGGTGLVGRNLLNSKIKIENQILLLTRSNPEKEIVHANINICNLIESNWKKKVADFSPEIIIHLASYLTSSDNENVIDDLLFSNINFGTHLLDSVKNSQLKLFINTGSFSEYYLGNDTLSPSYLYSATKTAFREILKYYSSSIGFAVINVVPYTIYGDNDRQKKIIDIIYDSMFSKNEIEMSPGDQVLDFIHIDDVVDFYKSLIYQSEKLLGKNLNLYLGTGVGTTPKEIANIFSRITNLKPNIKWGAIPYRKRDPLYSVADIKENRKILNWEPNIMIENGIKKYLKIKNL